MSLRKSFHWVLFALAMLPLTARAQGQAISPTVSMKEIIEKTAQHKELLHSAQAEYVERFQHGPDFRRVYHIPANAQLEPPEQTFSWVFKDDKRFRRFVQEGEKEKPANVQHRLESITHTEIYDGEKQFNLLTSNIEGVSDKILQGDIRRKRVSKLSPLSFGYVIDDEWVSDVLREGSFTVGTSTPDSQWGLLQEVSEEKQDSNGTLLTRLWFAPKHGYLVVRSERKLIQSFGGKEIRSQIDFNLERVEKRGAILFPIQGTMSDYQFEDGQKKLLSSHNLIVNQFELNKAPDNLFRIAFMPGTRITDVDTKEYFRIGLNGERIPIDITGNARTNNRTMGWLFMVSLSTLLVLFMGVLWRRQQKQRKVAA